MGIFTKIFSPDNYIIWVEVLTIAAILLVLGYFFFVLKVFKKGLRLRRSPGLGSPDLLN